jgi:hypothetical protein
MHTAANEDLYSLRFCKLNWRHVYAFTRNYNMWLDRLKVRHQHIMEQTLRIIRHETRNTRHHIEHMRQLQVSHEQLLHSNIPGWLQRKCKQVGVAADACWDVEAELRTLEDFQPPLLQLSDEDDPRALSIFQRAPEHKKKQKIAVATSSQPKPARKARHIN